MNQVHKSVADVAKQLGIDHEYILKELREFYENTEDHDSQSRLGALKELGKAIGTLGDKGKQVNTMAYARFENFSRDEIEEAVEDFEEIDEPKKELPEADEEV